MPLRLPESLTRIRSAGRDPVQRTQSRKGKREVHREVVLGPMLSLALHAVFLLIAAWLVIQPPLRSGDPGDGREIDLAGLADSQMSDLPDLAFDSAAPPIEASELTEQLTAEMSLSDLQITEMSLTDASGIETLGGAGEDVDASPGALGGGGGGTTFFGVAGQGRHFMYIVDVSGSMGQQSRLQTLKDNLNTSVQALPEYTSFFIFAYSDREVPMNGPTKWRRATGEEKLAAKAWINSRADGGGTDPSGAFERAFRFKPPPDVIYFMTDGEDIQGIPELVAELNSHARKTKIHCIAFGNRDSEDMMRRIARESGGEYRYVPSDGGG